MASPEDLLLLRAYVQDLSGWAASAVVPPECDAARVRLLEQAEHAVAEADGPLRIGVVGDFSAGKSLLLSILAGKPDLLPTSAEPTTGNITELRFLQDDAAVEPGRTGIDAVRVRFLDAEGLDGLQRTLIEAFGEVVKAGFADSVVEGLNHAAAEGPDAVTAWCRTAWPIEDQTLRALIREWVHTREAAAAAQPLLGRTFPIPVTLLPAALRLAHPALPTRFPEPSEYPERISPGSQGSLDAPSLTRGFPLIDRVCLDLRVPRSVWDLSALRGRNEFALLDFPGIGGSPARARDRFLAERGLEGVETILVLVDSMKPGGPAPDAFYRSLRTLGRSDEVLADSMIYCAGGFDRLRPPSLAAGAGRMTVDRLTGDYKPLGVLLASGHRPGVSSVQAFVSSVLAFATGAVPGPAPDEVGLDIQGPAARASAARWHEIALALAADGNGAELANTLTAFTKDGGIARLRALLEEHVRRHGLRLRLNRMAELVDEIDLAKGRLVVELRAAGGVDRSEGADRAARARRMFTEVNNRRIRLVDRVLPTLRDPSAIPFGPGGSLRDQLAHWAAELVVAWSQWAAVFECVEDAVIVPPRASAEPGRDRGSLAALVFRDAPRASAHKRLPQSMEELVEPFVDSCLKLRQLSVDALGPGLSRWLAQRSAENADLRRRAGQIVDTAARGRIAAHEDLGGVVQALELLLDPAALTEGTLTVLSAMVKPADDTAGDAEDEYKTRVRDAFPLRRDQIPGWATDPPGGPGTRHVVRALRMRSALIEKVTEIGLEDLGLLLERVHLMLTEVYDDETMRPNRHQIDAYVAAVRGERPKAEPSDAAESLDAIKRPHDEAGGAMPQ